MCVPDFAAGVTGAAPATGNDAQDMQSMGMGAGSACTARGGLSRRPVQQPVHSARTHAGFARAHAFVVAGPRASEAQDMVRDMRGAGSSDGGACAARGSAGSPRLERHEASTPSAALGALGATQCLSRQDVTIGDAQTDRRGSNLQDGQTDGTAERERAQGSPTKVGANSTGLEEERPRHTGTVSRDERIRVRRLFQSETVGVGAGGGGAGCTGSVRSGSVGSRWGVARDEGGG